MALRKVCIKVATDCEVIKIASREQMIEILDIVFIDEHNVRHLIKMPTSLVKSELVSYPFNRFDVIKIDRNLCVISVWKSPCSVCRLLKNENVFMVKVKASKPSIASYFFTCDEYTLKRIKDVLKESKLEYHMEVLSEHKEVLTPTQEYVLLLAFEMGYFNYPRKVTLKELSKALNMSPSTLNEILRRAIKNLIAYYIDFSKD
jgi:predicted DNA binding protein